MLLVAPFVPFHFPWCWEMRLLNWQLTTKCRPYHISLIFSQFYRHTLRVCRFCIDIMKKKNDSSILIFQFCLIYILMLGNYDPRGSRFKNPWTYSNQTLNLASFSYSLLSIGLSMEAHTIYYLIWGKTPSMQLK